MYRLISPLDGSEASVTESVAQSRAQAVVFAFLHSSQEGNPFPKIYLRGLDAAATYKLRMIEGKAAPGTPATATGAYWEQAGVQLLLRGDFQAAGLALDRVTAAEDGSR